MELILLLAAGAAGLAVLSNDSDDEVVDEPVEPEDLVQVTNAEGEELPFDALISPPPDPIPGDPIDYHLVDLVVSAPEEEHEIDVTSDADTTFLVVMNEHTTSVSADLSTQILEEGPTFVSTVTESDSEFQAQDEDGNYIEDDEGNPVFLPLVHTTTTYEYEGSANVTITIQPDELDGTQQRYTLHNPESSIHFDLDPSLNGHLHILRYGEEGGGEDHFEREWRYIVYTDENTPTLSQEDIGRIFFDGPENVNDNEEFNGIVLAEVFLGEDRDRSYYLDVDMGLSDVEERFSTYGLNETPLISVGGLTPNNTAL